MAPIKRFTASTAPTNPKIKRRFIVEDAEKISQLRQVSRAILRFAERGAHLIYYTNCGLAGFRIVFEVLKFRSLGVNGFKSG